MRSAKLQAREGRFRISKRKIYLLVIFPYESVLAAYQCNNSRPDLPGEGFKCHQDLAVCYYSRQMTAVTRDIMFSSCLHLNVKSQEQLEGICSNSVQTPIWTRWTIRWTDLVVKGHRHAKVFKNKPSLTLY